VACGSCGFLTVWNENCCFLGKLRYFKRKRSSCWSVFEVCWLRWLHKASLRYLSVFVVLNLSFFAFFK